MTLIVFPKKFRALITVIMCVLLLALVYSVPPTEPIIYFFIFSVGLTIFLLLSIFLLPRFSFYVAATTSYILYLSWKEILYIELFIYIFLLIILTEGYVVVSRRVLQ